MAPNYDIRFRGPNKLKMPKNSNGNDTMELLSVDFGITHARLKSNGMKVAVVPTGKCGSLMMRRLCRGGSRLEDRSTAGVSHVLEHADFRIVDWNQFGGMDKNASTSKLFIEHQTYMLLDPSTRHLEIELAFQRQTMLGSNLHMADEHLIKEVNNVKDEGLFNAQRGSYMRNMIMKMEDLLLPRVWSGGWTAPTIGLNSGQDISIHSSADLIKLHKKFRSPCRNTLVLAGPVDTTKTLQLVSDLFATVPANTEVMCLPQTKVPTETGLVVGNVSTNSGMRGLAIGFLVPPYGQHSGAISLLPHLVAMLGGQPCLAECGVTDVTMYVNQDMDASVGSILCKVSCDNENEEQAMRNAQTALEEHLLAPLCTFNDNKTLQELVRQLDLSVAETLQSGPQQAAAMAIQGVLAADKPSLAWHHKLIHSNVRAKDIQTACGAMFDPDQMGIVRATSYNGSVKTASRFMTHRLYGVPLTKTMKTQCCTRSLPPPNQAPPATAFMYKSRPPTISVLELNKSTTISYNASSVQPVTKKQIVALLGDSTKYGGWASSAIVVSALNEVAKCTNAHACHFSLNNGSVMATVSECAASPETGYHFSNPLLKVLAVSTAMARDIPGMEQLRASLPAVTLKNAIETTRAQYEDVSFQAQALARSKVCGMGTPGYVPTNFSQAVEQLYERHESTVALLQLVSCCEVKLAGTNVSSSVLQQVAGNMTEISKLSVALDVSKLKPLKHTVDITANAKVDGLRTFPFVSAMRASRSLQSREDRALLILSNQIMVGGMGAMYTHDLRQDGVSYRPSGGVQLSWQDNPVLTLSATFDKRDREHGEKRTQFFMRKWAQGDTSMFNATTVRVAAQSLREQVNLRSYEFPSLAFDVAARLSPQKLGSAELLQHLDRIEAKMQDKGTFMSDTLQKYFASSKVVDSIVSS